MAQSRGPVGRANFSDITPGIAVVGPGAVGTTVAGYLHAAGHPVLLCGRTPRPQLELRADGTRPIVVPGPVCTDPGDISGPVEMVVLAVKATQNMPRQMQSMKVSLHGPDPKHPGKQHLRFDLDKPDLVEKATKAGFRWFGGSDPLPYYFGGRQVNDYAAHIVRFSANRSVMNHGQSRLGWTP